MFLSKCKRGNRSSIFDFSQICPTFSPRFNTLKTPLLIFIMLSAMARVNAQTSLKANAGFGYLEHLALGATLSVRERSSFTVTYGSDLFYKPLNFSTWHFQYDRAVPALVFSKLIPAVGIKAGQTLFVDDFYRWKVFSAVPLISLSRKLSDAIEIRAEGGLAISRIQSVTRITYGEIGKYKRYLPEVKVSMRYTILKFNHE